MKRSKLLIVVLLIMLITLSGCSSQGSYDNVASESPMSPEIYGGSPAEYTSDGDMGISREESYITENKGSQVVEGVEQKKIKRGSILIEVEKLEQTYDIVRALVGENDGYIQSLREYSTNRDSSMQIILKIKSNNFEVVYEKIKELGKVREANMSSEDVTREYIDTKARIETLTVQEESLKNIMSKAEKVEDLLRVESELQRIRQQIESSQGNLNYLDSAINYSELNVSITMVKEPEKVADDMNIFDEFIFNIKDGAGYWANVLLNIINTILWMSPVIVVIIVILRLGKNKLQKTREKVRALINKIK